MHPEIVKRRIRRLLFAEWILVPMQPDIFCQKRCALPSRWLRGFGSLYAATGHRGDKKRTYKKLLKKF